MTFDDLEHLVANTRWFEHLAEPFEIDNVVEIESLAPWADTPSGNDRLEKIADIMDWLPSSRSEVDPIHGATLEDRARHLGKDAEFSKRSLAIYKKALISLGGFGGHPALRVGSYNFDEAARGAALFAVRRAAYEALLDENGFWCSIVMIYDKGHWPCGILPNAKIVVL